MLMATEPTGNLAIVREAFEGAAPAPADLSEPITQWCMIIVRPGMEQEARDALRRRGVGAYWPNYPKNTMVKDNRRTFLSPVVHGMIFSPAKFTNLFWNVIDLAPGVVNVARRAYSNIILLTDVDIVLIHKIEQGLNRPADAKAEHDFKAGEKVRLTRDERSAFGVGKVAKLYRDGRIGVEFGGMGRALTVTVDPLQIRRP
jgi:transcription antitermination factor NusG